MGTAGKSDGAGDGQGELNVTRQKTDFGRILQSLSSAEADLRFQAVSIRFNGADFGHRGLQDGV